MSNESLMGGLRHFLGRDLPYAIGGVSVIVSFLYLFDSLPPNGEMGIYSAFVVAIGYVLGYAIQELVSLTQIVTTQAHGNPGHLVKRLLYLLEQREWKDLPISYDWDTARIRIQNSCEMAQRAVLERTWS
jgi:hypothetical protein